MNPTNAYAIPSVSITTVRTGASSRANALGMRAMQERAYAKRGEPITAIGMGMLSQEAERELIINRIDTQTYKASKALIQQAQDQKSGKAQALDSL
jgi:hypothetical protein